MPKTVATALLLLAGLACSCGTGQESVELPEFPAEKTAADFPGISYPSFEGDLPQPASLGGPVWLIGVDGATWDLMDPMIRRGELPNFKKLVDEGAHGTLISEEPTISPALWATIATGMPRFVHGIVNFSVKLPGSYDTVQTGPPDRRSPAIWELVAAAGGRSLVVSWFGSYPAEEIPGVYISKGFDPENLHPGQVHPVSWMDLLRDKAVVRMRRQDVERIALTDFLSKALVEDARTLAAFRTVIEREQVDFAALYFSGTDVVQHVTWRDMDPASQQFPQDGNPDPGLSGVIPAYYRFVDNALGEITAMAPQGTTIVVVSDHGGGPMQPTEAYHFQFEVLLGELGLMDGDHGVAFAISELYRHEKSLWLNLEDVERCGIVPLSAAGDEAGRIAERLGRLLTDDGTPLFAAIENHAAGDEWHPGEPALTVRFSSDALVTTRATDGDRSFDFSPVRLRHTDVSGAHRLEGIVIMNGPAVRPGPLNRPATLYNIAPTLLYLLGLPQDGRMSRFAPEGGGVLEEVLAPGPLARTPVLMTGEYPGTDRSDLLRSTGSGSEHAFEPDPAAAGAEERLRALGYIR